MHINEGSCHDDIFQDKSNIPFLVGELKDWHDSVKQDEAELNEGHDHHPSGKLIILYHLVEAELLFYGHSIVEAENVHQYH